MCAVYKPENVGSIPARNDFFGEPLISIWLSIYLTIILGFFYFIRLKTDTCQNNTNISSTRLIDWSVLRYVLY